MQAASLKAVCSIGRCNWHWKRQASNTWYAPKKCVCLMFHQLPFVEPSKANSCQKKNCYSLLAVFDWQLYAVPGGVEIFSLLWNTKIVALFYVHLQISQWVEFSKGVSTKTSNKATWCLLHVLAPCQHTSVVPLNRDGLLEIFTPSFLTKHVAGCPAKLKTTWLSSSVLSWFYAVVLQCFFCSLKVCSLVSWWGVCLCKILHYALIPVQCRGAYHR